MSGENEKEDFHVVTGTVAESKFLAHAILLAERCHTGRGIWDEYYSRHSLGGDKETGGSDAADRDTADALTCLQYCVENTEDALYYFNRFIVVRNVNGNPVSCACGFKYPEASMGNALKGLRKANEELLQWTREESDEAESRLSFLGESFPDGIDFTGKWMIEAVYTHSSERGKGLAQRVMKHVLQLGRDAGCDEALITCAVGNDPAFRLYTKLGFEPLGCGNSQECMQRIHSQGFYVLRYSY